MKRSLTIIEQDNGTYVLARKTNHHINVIDGLGIDEACGRVCAWLFSNSTFDSNYRNFPGFMDEETFSKIKGGLF